MVFFEILTSGVPSASPRGLEIEPMEPISVNESAPGGACVLSTLDDFSVFILIRLDQVRRTRPHWFAVRRDLLQAKRFYARRADVHRAMRGALAVEGWLAG
jgi:hypothetical protein